MTPDPTFTQARDTARTGGEYRLEGTGYVSPILHVIDVLQSYETEDSLWLRNAAQRLRDNPITEENTDGE